MGELKSELSGSIESGLERGGWKGGVEGSAKCGRQVCRGSRLKGVSRSEDEAAEVGVSIVDDTGRVVCVDFDG